MNCRQFERRIQILLDQRRDVRRDRRLTEHSQHCGRCARAFRVYAAMAQMCWVDLLECPADGKPAEPDSLVTLPAEPRGEPCLAPSTPLGYRPKVTHILAVAAAVLILCALAWPHRGGAPRSLAHSARSDLRVVGGPADGSSLATRDALPSSSSSAAGDMSLDPWDSELIETSLTNIAHISGQLDQVRTYYYHYTDDLPGVRYLRTSLIYTVDLIRSAVPRRPDEPDPTGQAPDRLRGSSDVPAALA